jgi:hypothetical protein
MADIDLPLVEVHERSAALCSLRLYRDPGEYPVERVPSRYIVFSVDEHVDAGGEHYLEDDVSSVLNIVLDIAGEPDEPAEAQNPVDYEYETPPAARWVADERSLSLDVFNDVSYWYPTVGQTVMSVSGNADFFDADETIPMFGFRSSTGWKSASAVSLDAMATAVAIIPEDDQQVSAMVVGSFGSIADQAYTFMRLVSNEISVGVGVGRDNRLALYVSGKVVASGRNIFSPGYLCAVALYVNNTSVGFRAICGRSTAGASSYSDVFGDIAPSEFWLLGGSSTDVEVLEASLWLGDGADTAAARAAIDAVHYYGGSGPDGRRSAF